jgi:hypothetical protein
MNQQEEVERMAYLLFLKQHWFRLKAEGWQSSCLIPHIHTLWRHLSEAERHQWKLTAIENETVSREVDSIAAMIGNLNI